MVTNYPHGLTMRSFGTGRLASLNSGLFSWLLALLDQWMCGLRGHDEVLHFDDHRVQLRCTSCQHQSPGWEVGQRPPRLRYQGDARRHLLVTPSRRLQPVMVRKTA